MFFKTKSYITNLLFFQLLDERIRTLESQVEAARTEREQIVQVLLYFLCTANCDIIIISFPYGCCRCLLLCGGQAVTFVQHNVTSISNRLANWATAVALPSTAPNHAPRQPAPEPCAAVASVATKRFPTDPLAAAGLTSDWRAEIAAASARARGER